MLHPPAVNITVNVRLNVIIQVATSRYKGSVQVVHGGLILSRPFSLLEEKFPLGHHGRLN